MHTLPGSQMLHRARLLNCFPPLASCIAFHSDPAQDIQVIWTKDVVPLAIGAHAQPLRSNQRQNY